MDWIQIDKRLRELWNNTRDADKFLALVIAEFSWEQRQATQNTRHIFVENGLAPPIIEVITNKRG